MNIQDTLSYIHSNVWKGGAFGLANSIELMRLLGNPEKSLKFIHIAGTNGKGSTAAMTASVLHKAGYVVGLYTSPYIIRFNERIQINNVCIPDEDLCALIEEIRPIVEKMTWTPSEFELTTGAAMLYFQRKACDIVVLEVGLGGEMDSTNVIEAPEAAVITNIGLDHMQILGDTIEKIASAKAGIIKPGCDCVLYRQAPSVEAVFEETCKARSARLHLAEPESIVLTSHSLEGQVFDWKNLTGLQIPLLGAHQLNNASVVLKTVEVLRERGWGISDAAIREGLSAVTWPGRFQVLRHNPLFIIDGGHNPQCLEALTQTLSDYLPEQKIVFLNGCLADKDYGAMFRSLVPFAKEFVTVTPNNPRALPAEDLKANLEVYNLPVTACTSVREGVQTALEHAGKNGVVCCCGSLYMISDICAAVRELE